VCDILPETVEILSQHNNIIGIKEALDDSSRIKTLVQISKNNNNDFLIFSGDDPTFLQSLNIGAHGVISVAANVVPETISKICKYIRNKQLEEAKTLDEKNKNLYRLLFVESNPTPVKWILYKMGLISNSIRLPLLQLDETFHEEIMSELVKLELL
jgi:4-hydroxy-tetrahydrodipicolinate synthase